MNKIKQVLVGASFFAAIATGAIASDFGSAPANYENAAHSYVMSRLQDPRGAQMKVVSRPYKAVAKFRGRGQQEVWAVDVRVRSRLQSGRMGGYMPYTIVFLDGRAVALKSDIRDLDKI